MPKDLIDKILEKVRAVDSKRIVKRGFLPPRYEVKFGKSLIIEASDCRLADNVLSAHSLKINNGDEFSEISEYDNPKIKEIYSILEKKYGI